MLNALSEGLLVEARPGLRGTCPLCRTAVLAKCGQINVWHWAHETRVDCDDWWEPESDWHRDWKRQAAVKDREVTIEGGGRRHRADVINPVNHLVVELQASSISPTVIREREAFYGAYSGYSLMAWLFAPAKGLQVSGAEFEWINPRRSIEACKHMVFIDSPPLVFRLDSKRWFKNDQGLWGWAGEGFTFTQDEFIDQFFGRGLVTRERSLA